MRSGRLADLIGLLLVTLLGVLARLPGLDFSLPHYTPSDEQVMVDQVDNLRGGRHQEPLDGTMMPTYPLLGAYLAWPARIHAEGTGPAELDEHVARASALQLDLRAVTVLVSVLIVPGTWLLARRFLSPGWSTFAAALVALSTLSISNSQMARPHGPISALLVLGVVAAMRLGRRGTAGAYLLAGAATAAAVGYLHSGAALAGPLLVAHVLSRRRPGRTSGWWLLTVPALTLLAVRFTYLFHFERWTTAVFERDANEIGISGHRLWWGDFDGSGFLAELGTLYSYDPALLLTTVLGLCVLAASARRFRALEPLVRSDLLVAAAFALPYFLLMGVYARTAERFVMPLLPYAAAVSAFGLARLTRGRSGAVRAVAAGLPLALAAVGAGGLLAVRAGEDTNTRAARWIMAHLDPDTSRTFLIPYHTLPLLYGAESLQTNWQESRHTEWLEYLHRQASSDLLGPRWEVVHPPRRNVEAIIGDDRLAWLRRNGFDHVLIQHVSPNYKERILPELRALLQEEGELVARFTPMRRDDGEPARVDYNYSRRVLDRPFVWHLLQARGMGSAFELYRID